MSLYRPDFELKEGDTSPALESALTDDNGTAISLAGASVSFLMRKEGATSLTISDNESGNVTVTNAEEGIVKYEWQSGDTSRSGRYEAEWEVTYSDGTVETFPNTGYIQVLIREDLN